jgi:hypothetical protein
MRCIYVSKPQLLERVVLQLLPLPWPLLQDHLQPRLFVGGAAPLKLLERIASLSSLYCLGHLVHRHLRYSKSRTPHLLLHPKSFVWRQHGNSWKFLKEKTQSHQFDSAVTGNLDTLQVKDIKDTFEPRLAAQNFQTLRTMLNSEYRFHRELPIMKMHGSGLYDGFMFQKREKNSGVLHEIATLLCHFVPLVKRIARVHRVHRRDENLFISIQ